jgi:hypothetical protein
LGKPYGIKTWVLLGTSWGTNLGTLWEFFGNMMGTHWKKGGKTKKSLSPHPLKILRRKLDRS